NNTFLISIFIGHKQQHYRQRSSHRHQRRERKISQKIEISKDMATSNIEISIKSEGPIDTKIVLDPSVFGLTTDTVSSPSSPVHSLTTAEPNIPLNPPRIDLSTPPTPPPTLSAC
ncbi:unnamed protein product, partial [Rotaria sp. Silwood2]